MPYFWVREGVFYPKAFGSIVIGSIAIGSIVIGSIVIVPITIGKTVTPKRETSVMGDATLF
jgi:hypothetical protein